MGSPATPLAYELDGLKRRLYVLPTSAQWDEAEMFP